MLRSVIIAVYDQNVSKEPQVAGGSDICQIFDLYFIHPINKIIIEILYYALIVSP